eukprot:CAMPEP_0113574406 /NCGR_PEP_ID=MMETSP0015_2-20120614/27131_1 /TAXON_ID=2838 /ORGANISM="Odontella" /LENGTH=107 /DNA_ID=CAMNT_0000477543 /DNA_START=223 /DNA_END=546 /DNA_ORIENTATION=+ /assembly_acc=CAM_ASM_000160
MRDLFQSARERLLEHFALFPTAVYDVLWISFLIRQRATELRSILNTYRTFVRTALQAEAEWTPADGAKWTETDWEGKLDKLQKEAEDRLDDKIQDLMRNVESTGKSS